MPERYLYLYIRREQRIEEQVGLQGHPRPWGYRVPLQLISDGIIVALKCGGNIVKERYLRPVAQKPDVQRLCALGESCHDGQHECDATNEQSEIANIVKIRQCFFVLLRRAR